MSNLSRTDVSSDEEILRHRMLSTSQQNLGPRFNESGSWERSGNYRNVSGSTLQLDNDWNQTPSPSDSGVAELEAILKERDSEINFLRETMEQNEQVIFKVYEEKEKSWDRELKKIRGIFENRLKATQQRALRMEQTFLTQTYQVW